jgi:hypothetical protein
VQRGDLVGSVVESADHRALPVGWVGLAAYQPLPFHSVEHFGHPSVVMPIRSAICVGVA